MATTSGTGVSAKRRKVLREPDPFLQRSMQAFEWLQGRRKMLVPAAVAVAVVAAGTVAWSEVTSRSNARAAESLARALVVANAEVRGAAAPDEEAAAPEEPADDRPVFQSVKSRARASLHAFRRMLKAHGDSKLAPVARLGEASALYDLERVDEAKRAYERVLGMDGVPPDLRAQATDGAARCLEEKGDLAGALRQLEALRTMENGAFRDIAQFGRARIYIKQGKHVQARELLQKLQSDLMGEDAPDRPYLRPQVEARMRELESLAPAASSEGDGDGGGERGGRAKGSKSGGRGTR